MEVHVWPFKIAFIGAGAWLTRTLPGPADCAALMEIAFTDIGKPILGALRSWRKGYCRERAQDTDHAITDRRKHSGARCSTGAHRRARCLSTDVRSLRYGIDQCVGIPWCRGIMYGQRGIPVMLEFCRISEKAELGALLNYANPML